MTSWVRRRKHIARPMSRAVATEKTRSDLDTKGGRNGISQMILLEIRRRRRFYCLERELHGIFLKIIGAKVSPRLVSITFIINSK